MMLPFHLAFITFVLVGSGVSAQDIATSTIKGKVIDNNTQMVIMGAIVSTIPSLATTSTDENGLFELQVPDSIHQLHIQYLGYREDTINIIHRQSEITIALHPDATLNEVVISKRIKSTEANMMSANNMINIGGRELAKAACCNLSESFETTPSIDVGFTDAVSGYKQISMLGLASANTLFTRENIPDIRGLAAITGLTFTPGTWVESMQLSKGSGSVVNGFEGAAGQINVEWQKPFTKDAPTLLLNGYQSSQGRSEGNVVYNQKINDKLSTNLLLHGRGDWLKVDENNDGFLDQPLGKTFIGSNRWFYFTPNGLEIQGGIKGIYVNNTGGQKDFNKNEINSPYWGYENKINRAEVWAKIGKVYIDQPWKSMGLQLSGTYHNQNSRYGVRNYTGKQQSFYANYIYQSIIGNTNNIIKAGASFSYDHYDEHFQNEYFNRNEIVSGIFTEYTYTYLTKFSMVAGIRADYHNIYGAFITPRLHLRYAPFERSVLRASIGRAQRTNNILADNQGYMASGRVFEGPQNFLENKKPFGLDPEVVWNMGLNFTQKFMLNYRDGTFSMDYYYSNFTNQAVVDIETPGIIKFYNLKGKSYAHSFQGQLDYEPVRMFDVRLAYRYYDVKTTYNGALKEKPLVAKHRAFMNLAYETRNHWKFDYTVQWIGAKRLPNRFIDETTYQPSNYSPSFVLMNAQITKQFINKKLEVYIGTENITNYIQHHLILGADNPFGNKFDASIVWGPGMGRNMYLGLRYKL